MSFFHIVVWIVSLITPIGFFISFLWLVIAWFLKSKQMKKALITAASFFVLALVSYVYLHWMYEGGFATL